MIGAMLISAIIWLAILVFDMSGGFDSSPRNGEPEEPEFGTWAWMDHAELVEKIVPFKRDTYRQVFDEFADLIGVPA